MSFTTCSPAIVAYWKYLRVPTKLVAKVDGVSYVRIDIPDKDPRLKHPDFFSLAVKSKRYETEAVISHMRTPIYTIKKEGRYSDTLDKEGNRAVPLTRQVGLLNYFFTNLEEKKQDFVTALLANKKALMDLLQQAIDDGIGKIIYMATKTYTLDFPVVDTLQVIRHRK